MRFEGRYYKHQKGGDTVCMIVGQACGKSFLQIVDGAEVCQFEDFPGCSFSDAGVALDLPGVKGEIAYSNLTPLSGDIMGPFRFFPMQCRHSVVSMRHELRGGLEIGGRTIDFTGGTGYIEGDSGRAFPKNYFWVQCNDFEENCAVMTSVADVPFMGFCFRGCICAVAYRGKEYRLATYRGVRVEELSDKRLVLTQKNLRLEIDIEGKDFSPLKKPGGGGMNGVIRECNNARGRFRFTIGGEQLFDRSSNGVSFEYERSFSKAHF
ncbi:MAG: tocopherol cyclase family protein [Firmicutes bacterium]|nr:tocopherol cyclase family protein [Bacillota bacterium]